MEASIMRRALVALGLAVMLATPARAAISRSAGPVGPQILSALKNARPFRALVVVHLASGGTLRYRAAYMPGKYRLESVGPEPHAILIVRLDRQSLYLRGYDNHWIRFPFHSAGQRIRTVQKLGYRTIRGHRARGVRLVAARGTAVLWEDRRLPVEVDVRDGHSREVMDYEQVRAVSTPAAEFNLPPGAKIEDARPAGAGAPAARGSGRTR